MGWIARLNESYRKYKLIKTSNQILSDYEKALAFGLKPSFSLNEYTTFRKLRSLEKSYVDNWQDGLLQQQPKLRQWLNGQEGLSYQAHYANTFLRLRLLAESHLAVWRIKAHLDKHADSAAFRLTDEQQRHLQERDNIVSTIKECESSLSAEKSSWYRITRPTKSLWVAHRRLANPIIKKLKQILIASEEAPANNTLVMVHKNNLERSIILRSVRSSIPAPKSEATLSAKSLSKITTRHGFSFSLPLILYRGVGALMRSVYRNNMFLNSLSSIRQRDIVTLNQGVQSLAQQQAEQAQELKSIAQEIEILKKQQAETQERIRQFEEIQPGQQSGFRAEIEASKKEILELVRFNLSIPASSSEAGSCKNNILPAENNEKQSSPQSEVSLKGFLSSGMSFLSPPDNKAILPSAMHPVCSVEEKIISPPSSVLTVH